MNLFDLVGTISLNAGQALGDLGNFEQRLQSVGSKLTGAGTGMMALGASIAAPAAGIIKFGIDYNSTMQDLETSFKVMLGSQEKATNMTQKLIDMGAATPFEATQLAEYTKTMLSFGYTEANVIPIMSRLGDVSLGNDAKMSSLTRTMGQINALGKLQGGDLNQLIGQGWNPLNAIMKKTGETTAEVRKRMEAGKVTYKEVEQALIATTNKGGQFYRGMAEGAKTFSGQMSTLRDVVGQTMGQITKPLFDLAMQVLPKVIEKLGAAQKWFSSLSTGSQRMAGIILLGTVAFGGLIMVLGALLIPLGMVISAIGTIGIPVTAAIVAIGPLIAIISALIIKTGLWRIALGFLKSAFNIIQQVVGVFKAKLTETHSPITAMQVALRVLGMYMGVDLTRVIKLLTNAIGFLKTAFSNSKSVLTTFIAKLKESRSPTDALQAALKKLGSYTSGDLNKILKIFSNMIKQVGDSTKTLRTNAMALIPHLIRVGNATIQAGASVGKFVMGLVKLVSTIAASVLPVILKFGNAIVKTVGPALMGAIAAIMKFVSVLLNILKVGLDQIIALWKVVWPFLAKILQPVLNFIIDLLKGAFDIIKNLFNVLTSVLTLNWTGTWKGILGILDSACNVIRSLFTNLWNVIVAIWSAILAAITAVNNAIGSFLKSIWSDISGFMVMIAQKIWSALSSAWSKIYASTMSQFSAIGSFLKSAMSIMLSAVSSAWNAIKSAFSAGASAAKNFVSNMVSGIKSIISTLASAMYNFGANAIKSFASGISSMAGRVKDAASSVVKGVKSMLGFSSPTEEGPGKDSDTWAPNLMNMMSNGILDNKDKLKDAAMQAAEGLSFQGAIDVKAKYSNGKGMVQKQGVSINIYNPKFFNQQDVDKMMNPVIRRLQNLGIKSY